MRGRTTGTKTLQSAQSAVGAGTVMDLLDGDIDVVAVYVIWSAGVSAGVVTIEAAEASDYTGTWALDTLVSWTAASKVDIVKVAAKGVKFLRARISTTITGGTVTVKAVGCL